MEESVSWDVYESDARDMSAVPTDSVDLVVTSPPYNVSVPYEATDDDLELPEYESLLADVFAECRRVLRPDGGRLVVNSADVGHGDGLVPASKLVYRIAQDVGFGYRTEIIWDKAYSAGRGTTYGSWMSASCPAVRDFHEYVQVYFTGDQFKRADSGESTMDKQEFMDYSESMWRFDGVPSQGRDHPAPFPVDLPERAINLYSYKGDTVLDPFVGSGTTGVAAVRLDRDFVGYDVSESYCDMARSRIKGEVEQTTLVGGADG